MPTLHIGNPICRVNLYSNIVPFCAPGGEYGSIFKDTLSQEFVVVVSFEVCSILPGNTQALVLKLYLPVLVTFDVSVVSKRTATGTNQVSEVVEVVLIW